MTKPKPLPGSPEFLTAVRKALSYDAMNGVLRWLHNDMRAGLDVTGQSYLVRVAGSRCSPESLAWLIQTGEWCVEVGFCNGINVDLRWSNLFDARTQCEVTVSRCGDLFVLRNGEEQVVVGDRLDEVLVIAADILKGGPVASMAGN